MGNASGCQEVTTTSNNFWIQSRERQRQQPGEMILHISDGQVDWFFHRPGDFGQLVASFSDLGICIQVSHDVLEQICPIFCFKST